MRINYRIRNREQLSFKYKGHFNDKERLMREILEKHPGAHEEDVTYQCDPRDRAVLKKQGILR